jgi:hypothetical protein
MPNVRWEESENKLTLRLFVDDEYKGKLFYTVVGDKIADITFVRATDHKRFKLVHPKDQVLMILGHGRESVEEYAKRLFRAHTGQELPDG